MGIQDNKTLSFNISGRQMLGLAVILVLCFVAIYFNALTIGYVVVTLALCAFFLMVAFDYGIREGAPEAPVERAEEAKPDDAQRPRTGRNARTA